MTPPLAPHSLDLPARRRDRIAARLLHAPPSQVWRVMGWAFTLGCSAHLLIADAWQLSWLLPNLLLLLSALYVAWRPCALAFLIALPGVLWPLLFLRDQLTQSVLLALFALSAVLALIQADAHSWRHAQRIWRAIVTSTYALAALHKLNEDFLNPQTSCAVYGWQEVLATWHIPSAFASPSPAFEAMLPFMVIGTETLVALLYLCRLRRPAWALSLAFHLPLTMTMAPAFAFVMLIGHAAWIEQQDLDHVRALWRSHRTRLIAWLAMGVGGALTSVALAKTTPEPSVILRELILWCLFATSLTWRRKAWLNRHLPHLTHRTHLLTILFLGGFWVNGLSPYTGTQMQHAGAMLSNLRIDEGCWNSLVFPEAWRLTEDYIRVDEVYFGAPGVDESYEALLRTQLWSPPQLRQMQRNWCTPSRRPFYLGGTWRGRSFEILDLCAVGPHDLPFEGAGIWGVELFPDAIRFQKNLARDCPQRCIH